MPIKAQPPSKILRRTVLSDDTYDSVRSMILKHEIPPGTKVNIDALAIQLGISQTPIREALARLESDGLIAKEALKGYSTTNLLTVKQFKDLFQFRLLIEPWAAEMSAQRIDSVGIAALKAEMQTAKSALKLKEFEQVQAFIEHDARFHSLITRISGNESVTESFERTHCHLHLFRLFLAAQSHLIDDKPTDKSVEALFKRYFPGEQGVATIEEHTAIADAISTGNGKRAKSAMTTHIQSALDRFSPATEALNK
jgi:DNA-binding GntR family transcriptional regulator